VQRRYFGGMGIWETIMLLNHESKRIPLVAHQISAIVPYSNQLYNYVRAAHQISYFRYILDRLKKGDTSFIVPQLLK